MHMDHVGGLLVEDVNRRLNPDVRIHVTATEIAFWQTPDFDQTAMPNPVPEVLRKTATQFIDAYADKIMAFDEECEVAPGVVAKLTGGHTPGHCVVHVRSEEHTSELQSLMRISYAVFCLKKKKKKQ